MPLGVDIAIWCVMVVGVPLASIRWWWAWIPVAELGLGGLLIEDLLLQGHVVAGIFLAGCVAFVGKTVKEIQESAIRLYRLRITLGKQG